jgi:hypothetical protein
MSSLLEPKIGWPQLAIMALGLVLAYEICYRVGRHRREESRDAKKSQADLVVAALLALLGLMLAFSFEIGATRFDRRKGLVLDEANAIATTYLRAKLLPVPYDQRIQQLLRAYVEARHGWSSPEELEQAIKKSSSLHGELWSNAVAAAHATPTPVTALFIASLNNMIDLHEARVTVGLYQRIPPAIFASLYLVSLLSLGMVGARAGLDRSRGPLPAAILVTSIICVMALIASLDDPVSRLFRISQHALDDTERMMKAEPTQPTAASDPRPDP